MKPTGELEWQDAKEMVKQITKLTLKMVPKDESEKTAIISALMAYDILLTGMDEAEKRPPEERHEFIYGEESANAVRT